MARARRGEGGGKIPNRLCIFSLLPDINLFEYLHRSIIKF